MTVRHVDETIGRRGKRITVRLWWSERRALRRGRLRWEVEHLGDDLRFERRQVEVALEGDHLVIDADEAGTWRVRILS